MLSALGGVAALALLALAFGLLPRLLTKVFAVILAIVAVLYIKARVEMSEEMRTSSQRRAELRKQMLDRKFKYNPDGTPNENYKGK